MNCYGAIIALCESSLFMGGRDRLAGKIVTQCKREIQKELVRYDTALFRINALRGKPL